ncbi:MAG TPA: hypothetical protein VGO09_00725, partial [Flavisolibacter sp.]|nr:hypothetical protein [Flavisolibacter sp.]
LKPADLKGEWNFLNFTTQKNPKISALTYLKDNIRWVLSFVQKIQAGKNLEDIPNKQPGCKQIFIE